MPNHISVNGDSQNKIKYLGHYISHDGIHVDPDKIK